MPLEIIGILMAASHVLTLALIILWFGLDKPKSRKEFWIRFKREYLTLSPQRR